MLGSFLEFWRTLLGPQHALNEDCSAEDAIASQDCRARTAVARGQPGGAGHVFTSLRNKISAHGSMQHNADLYPFPATAGDCGLASAQSLKGSHGT